MEKEKFIYLYKFNYNNKKFEIFWNKKTGCFPLELIDGALVYSDYEDYIEIFKKLESKDSLHTLLHQTGKSFNNSRNDKVLYNNKIKYFIFKPLVRIATGLISYALALSLSGCVLANPYNQNDPQYIENVIEQAKSQDIVVEYNQDIDEFFVKEFIDEDNKRVIFVSDMNQLRQYFPEEKQDPTYADLHTAINNNFLIPHNVKTILHEVADNLEKNAPNLDLFLFYYNLRRMHVIVINDRYVYGESSGDLAGFDHKTGEMIFYYNNLDIHTYGHECGHVASCLRKDIDDDTTILFRIYPIIYTEYTNKIYHINGYEEGVANIFALLASDMKQYDSQRVDNTYVPFTEGTKVILNSIGWTIEDLIEKDVIKFLKAMKSQGIEEPISSLSKLSRLYYFHSNSEYDPEAYGFEDWIYDYAYEIGKYDIYNEQYDPSDIEMLFDNSAFNGDIVPTNIMTDDGPIAVDMYHKKSIEDAVLRKLEEQLEIRSSPIIGKFLSLE